MYDGMLRPHVKHTVTSTQKVNECFTPIKMGEDLSLVEQALISALERWRRQEPREFRVSLSSELKASLG